MDTIGIHTERAVIEIVSTPASMKIRTQRPRFQVEHSRPVMHVSRKTPTFKVKWSQLRPQRLPGTPAPKRKLTPAQRKAISDVVGYAQDHPMAGGASAGISEVVRERLSRDFVDLNTSMRQAPPEIEWDNGYMKIQWESHKMEIRWDVEIPMTSVEVEPYSVEVRLRNRPSVQIWVNRDETTGEIVMQSETWPTNAKQAKTHKGK